MSELFFGYDLKLLPDGKGIQFAYPEKALLDLLYLYPEYNSSGQLEDLRLDDDFLHDTLNKKLLQYYLKLFKSKALERRVQLLFSVYGL